MTFAWHQTKKMKKTVSNYIVFITGTFIGNNCWDEWKIYFESNGYNCIAPAWPHKDAPPEELRNRHPDPTIALNNLPAITDHFAGFVNTLPEKPILIGHSLGGLVVQLLLQRGLGTAGVAMHSFPPSGVSSFRFSFMKAVWEAMSLFTSSKETYLMPFSTWKYTIANGMDYEEQKELYYRYAIPESKRIIRDMLKCVAIIDFKKSHAPLLFTSGSDDRLTPVSLNYNNYKKYKTGNSKTDYMNFKGSNHLVFGRHGWTEEVDFILDWLQKLK